MEKTRNRRGLEDVSHFFLSGKKSDNPSEAERGGGDADTKESFSTGGDHDAVTAESSRPAVQSHVALPVDGGQWNKTNIVEAAEEFLQDARPGRFVSVKNIRSSQFGSSDITLFDKEESHILCGKIQGEAWFSDFLVSSLGYYFWLKESLVAGGPLFERNPRFSLYLFCNRFPSQARQVVKRLKETMSIFLVRYHLLQIPDRRNPVVYFQPVVSENQPKNPGM